MKDNQPSKKYLDATKPEDVPVSHTSKPSIVNNQSAHRDPMTLDKDESNIQSIQHKKIDPIHEGLKDNQDDDQSNNLNKEKDEEENLKIKNQSTETPEHNEDENSDLQEKQSKTSETTESTVNTKVSESTNTIEEQNIDKGSEPSKDEATVLKSNEFSERAKEIQDLIDKKTYNLPIRKAHSKKLSIIIIGVTLIILTIGVAIFIFK